MLRLDTADRLVVFAGQADPADPTHFTIDCVVNGERTTIDGHILDESSIRLTPRKGLMHPNLLAGFEWYPPGSLRKPPTTYPSSGKPGAGIFSVPRLN
jgi:hypothetical protein